MNVVIISLLVAIIPVTIESIIKLYERYNADPTDIYRQYKQNISFACLKNHNAMFTGRLTQEQVQEIRVAAITYFTYVKGHKKFQKHEMKAYKIIKELNLIIGISNQLQKIEDEDVRRTKLGEYQDTIVKAYKAIEKTDTDIVVTYSYFK